MKASSEIQNEVQKAVQKIRRSIFVKLLLIFATTAVLVISFLWGMASHFAHVHDEVWNHRNLNRMAYGNLLIDKIGNPPNLNVADEIARTTGMRIRIEGGGVNYANPPSIGTLATLMSDSHHCVWTPDSKIMTQGGHIYIMIVRAGYNYLFSYENDNFLDERPEWWPILVTLILFALLFNYLATRWLFLPINWLSDGLKKVQQGDLQSPIPTRENDELGDLAKSFNGMTKDVATMLQSKEQLLLDVSHELRSPLTRMKVALELDDDGMIPELKKNVRDLEIMIAELLESARLDTPQGKLLLGPSSVDAVVQHAASKFKAETPGVLILPLPKDLSFMVDPSRIETVLRNLLENALKYSKHQSKPVEISAHAEAFNEVWIEIRDFGTGIPEDERALVFEPFYRVDKSRVRETGGYGLGLALCKKIMLAHGGSIEVADSSDDGTVFRLKFTQALAYDEAYASEAVDPASSSPLGGRI